MYSFEAQLKEQSEDASKREVAIQSTLGGIISCLKERVTLLANQTVTTPVGIGKFLKLSPDSMGKVTQYSGRGIFQTTTLRHATPTAKRSGFLVNVVNCLRPIIQKICEIPKFRDGRTDATGVCELVLASMRKNKVERITTNKRGGVTVVSVSSTRKRKLFVNADDRTPESRKRCKQSLSLPLDEPCRHPHSEPTRCPPIPALDPKCTEKCAESGCKTRAAANCKYCPVSWCRPHLENKLCRSEHLPAATSEFVCPQCRPKIDAHRHSKEGCATCNEIEFFKEDLVLCARRTKCADLISKALNLCDAIDTIVGHNARIVNQERFWPAALDRMKDRKQYDHVLLKSDYWKKFEGTALKVGLTLNPTLTLTLTLNLNPYPNPNTEFATRWVYVKQTRSRV